MYNGIGLGTARGSGTNGHVQKNMSYIKPRYKQSELSTQTPHKSLLNSKSNKDILMHDKKRQVEIKCIQLQEMLENKNELSKDEIEEKVNNLRNELLVNLEQMEMEKQKVHVHETHYLVEEKARENEKFAKALGIKVDEHVEGEAFDSELQQRKKEVRRMEKQRKYLEAEVLKRQRERLELDERVEEKRGRSPQPKPRRIERSVSRSPSPRNSSRRSPSPRNSSRRSPSPRGPVRLRRRPSFSASRSRSRSPRGRRRRLSRSRSPSPRYRHRPSRSPSPRRSRRHSPEALPVRTRKPSFGHERAHVYESRYKSDDKRKSRESSVDSGRERGRARRGSSSSRSRSRSWSRGRRRRSPVRGRERRYRDSRSRSNSRSVSRRRYRRSKTPSPDDEFRMSDLRRRNRRHS